MSTQPTVKLLHGRDRNGFAIGSEAAREAAKLYAAAERQARQPELTTTEKLKARLLCPENPTPKRKSLARSAAEALGVDVPEWADKQTHRKFTEEHKRRLSESARRRWGL